MSSLPLQHHLDVDNLVAETSLHRLLLYRVKIGVDIYCENILVLFQFPFHFFIKLMVVLNDETKLGAVDIRLLVFFNLCKRSSHDGNDHIEDNEKRDKGSNEEYDPENEHLVAFGVVAETLSNLKVSKCQSVGIY